MMLFADIASGYTDAADWLFLIAAILFVLYGLILATGTPDKTKGSLLPAGLALVAIAWLLL